MKRDGQRQEKSYRLVPPEGLNASARREVLILECTPPDRFVNALARLSKPRNAEIRSFLAAMELWIVGDDTTKRHHGWSKTQHGGRARKCHVFRYTGKAQGRLYGFLDNPKAEDPRFQVCVVVHHCYKRKKKTDPRIFSKLEKLRTDHGVRKAIKVHYMQS